MTSCDTPEIFGADIFYSGKDTDEHQWLLGGPPKVRAIDDKSFAGGIRVGDKLPGINSSELGFGLLNNSRRDDIDFHDWLKADLIYLSDVSKLIGKALAIRFDKFRGKRKFDWCPDVYSLLRIDNIGVKYGFVQK